MVGWLLWVVVKESGEFAGVLLRCHIGCLGFRWRCIAKVLGGVDGWLRMSDGVKRSGLMFSVNVCHLDVVCLDERYNLGCH